MIRIKDTRNVQLNIDGKSAIALGKFDGIHQGHMLLIDQVIASQREGYTGIIFTFDMKPNSIFDVEGIKNIYTSDEKQRIAKDTGVDILLEYPFDDYFAFMKPERFVREILSDMLHAGVVIVGSDFRFGRERSGDADLLRTMGAELGFEVMVIPKMEYEGRDISSTRIRGLISEGNMTETRKLLGRYYSMSGQVVKGKQLGRTIGIPTANILPEKYKLYPPKGVYASRVKLVTKKHGVGEDPYRSFGAVTNIGENPTVNDDGNITIETHIFDFDRDIYDFEIEVELISKLRDEQKFDTLEDLKTQMNRDMDQARDILKR